jgi:hypothetical protein
MVIQKGEEWGEHVHQQGVICTRDDHEVLSCLAYPIEGDIARTLGSGTRMRSSTEQFNGREDWHKLPFDVIEIDMQQEVLRAAAHVRAGHLLWGECHILANVAFFKGNRVFAQSHPNDGKVEVLTVSREMKFRQRLLAAVKARKGSHLPHPHLSSRQLTNDCFLFSRPLPIFVDGKKVGICKELRISVVADAINIYIPSDHK